MAARPPPSPMLSEPVWLFDLDNTLHDANPHIFPHINRSMREYIERHLGVDEDEANRLRQHYWARYGATLLGLMRHHGTDPVHFLQETHRFADLKGMLVFERAVKTALRRLPGRKIVFSNGPSHYTREVLRLTGLAPLFDAVYSVDSVGFRPKPMREGFRALLKAERLNPRDCIMVEDSVANLVAAKSLGMRTVWVSSSRRHPLCVDTKIRSVLDLPRRIGRL